MKRRRKLSDWGFSYRAVSVGFLVVSLFVYALAGLILSSTPEDPVAESFFYPLKAISGRAVAVSCEGIRCPNKCIGSTYFMGGSCKEGRCTYPIIVSNAPPCLALKIPSPTPSPKALPSPSPSPSMIKRFKVEELTGERSVSSKVFRNSDNTRTAEIYAVPIHYRASDGALKEISTKIKPAARGVFPYEVTENAFQTYLNSKSSEANFLKLAVGEKFVHFKPLTPNDVSASIAGNVISFKDIYQSTDFNYAITQNSLKEEIILKGPDAPTSFSFNFQSSGVHHRVSGNSIEFLEDGTNKPLFLIQAPFMRDASGAKSNSVSLNAEPAGQEVRITVSADAQWINSADRKFPIVVDPTLYVIGSGARDGYIHKSFAATYTRDISSTTFWVGDSTPGLGCSPTNPPCETDVGFTTFDISSIPVGSAISEANLSFWVRSAVDSNVEFKNLSQAPIDPPVLPDDNATNYRLFQAIENNATWGAPVPWPLPQVLVGERSYNWSADSTFIKDLQNARNVFNRNLFSVGWREIGEINNFRARIESADNTTEGGKYAPKLIVVYTPSTTACGTLNSPNTVYQLSQSLSTTGTCFTITADNIVLDGNGFTISGDGGSGDYGVSAVSRKNLTIKNLKITGFQRGISFESVDNSFVDSVVVSSNVSSGVHLLSSSNNTISHTIVYNTSFAGFYLYSTWPGISKNNTYSFNTVYSLYCPSGSSYGFIVVGDAGEYQSPVNNTFYSNTAFNNSGYYGNGYGFYVSSAPNNNLFANNTAYKNPVGFYEMKSNNNSFINNTAVNNTLGFYLIDTNFTILSNNTAFNNSEYGFYLYSNSRYNRLYNNTAFNNFHHGFCLESSDNNTLYGNRAFNNFVNY
ncbi:right-handed parallel beta-helix repeat-containing protein, partial [Candidatus Micrarchaeota archaeon]|nr:right-handed parallel beta-helix repeat-containing protein [Candidatus Micrarchaeota archaeon]